jgi:F-type H+-transporting ATPase subunit alpha
MKIRHDEISSIIEKELSAYEPKLKMESVGTVIGVGDGIARIYGLSSVMVSELVEFPGGVYGIALNLEEDSVGCIVLGDDTGIKEGDTVKCTGKIIQVPVGKPLLGRVVNPIGQPIDDKGPIPAKKFRPIEGKAKNVIERQPVKEPLQTGWKAIDSMIPIGRGQRELVLGDRQTGKTALVIDTIINQKDEGVFCVYVAIGQKSSNIASVVDTLSRYGAMEWTTVVVASASDSAAMQFVAPYAGCAMGEEFRDEGKHALVIYDDLSKHAWAYRQLSLLLRRPPGREAYPGDIFNLHSRLLERASKLSDELGGGSLTAIPIIETQLGDVSAYIPTNVISITDGQIYLEPDLFYAGVRPAINVGISVSRVGGAAQMQAMKRVAGKLRLELAQYRELATFAQFATELDKAGREQLQRGEKLVEILKQPQFAPMLVEDQVTIIFAGTQGFLDDISAGEVKRFEDGFHKFIAQNHPAIREKIRKTKKLDEQTEAELRKACEEYKTIFKRDKI